MFTHNVPLTRFNLILILATTLCLAGSATAQETTAKPDQVISIWPDAPPAWIAPEEQERDTTKPDGRTVAGKRVKRISFVSKPQLHVYRAKQPTSETAILVCPGGGYSILAWDLEGTEIATWLQGIGVTALVVKYRVPTRKSETNWRPPVQDIQRAISLVRSGGVDGVSAKQIGVLGFSAGGNASARVTTASERHYDAVDRHDQASAKPDFAVLVYPAWLIKQDDPTQLIDELHVDDKTPPIFFAHAADDRISCMSSVTLFGNLKEHGIASSLHVFASGGHGFGARAAGKPTDAWPGLCETWMRNQGWLK